jgi:hypothetical protein
MALEVVGPIARSHSPRLTNRGLTVSVWSKWPDRSYPMEATRSLTLEQPTERLPRNHKRGIERNWRGVERNPPAYPTFLHKLMP